VHRYGLAGCAPGRPGARCRRQAGDSLTQGRTTHSVSFCYANARGVAMSSRCGPEGTLLRWSAMSIMCSSAATTVGAVSARMPRGTPCNRADQRDGESLPCGFGQPPIHTDDPAQIAGQSDLADHHRCGGQRQIRVCRSQRDRDRESADGSVNRMPPTVAR